MLDQIKRCGCEEDGAVTVDWVDLTSLILAINIGLIVGLLENGINTAASDIFETITSVTP